MTSPHRSAVARLLSGVLLLSAAACSQEPAKPAASAPAAAPEPAPPPSVRVYVTTEQSGDLTVINGDTQAVMATAPLGKRPRGIQVSPDGKSLYVALSGSPPAGPGVDPKTLPPPDRNADGIGEVDADTYKLKRIIHAGADPEQLAVSADGTRLYVANEDIETLSVVDVATGTVIAAVKVGEEPEGVTIRPDGKVVYVTSEGDGAVFAIDTQTNKLIKRIPVGPRPRSIGFLPDGSRGYVSLENQGAIAVFDAKQQKFLRLINLEGQGNTPKARPMGITVSPDGATVYVTTGSFGHLFYVDPATNKQRTSFEVGQRPWGIALMPGGKIAYTANGPSNDVSVVDLDAKQVVKKITVGNRPWGVAIVTRR
jgi:YVTN family beta-propeller protein